MINCMAVSSTWGPRNGPLHTPEAFRASPAGSRAAPLVHARPPGPWCSPIPQAFRASRRSRAAPSVGTARLEGPEMAPIPPRTQIGHALRAFVSGAWCRRRWCEGRMPSSSRYFGDGAARDGKPLALEDTERLPGRTAAWLVPRWPADPGSSSSPTPTRPSRRRPRRSRCGRRTSSSNSPCGRLDVLVGGDAADRGLVHADVLAHVAQRRRAAGTAAPVQELALELHDRLRSPCAASADAGPRS